jgi:hypothetical protein
MDPVAVVKHSLAPSPRGLVMRLRLAAIALVVLPSALRAQAATDTTPPRANPADVASPDAIIAALYDVISGPAGQARDWNRFRSLFAPGARLIPSRRPPGAPPRPVAMTPDEYAQRAAPGLTNNGFFEHEIGRSMDRFGSIAQLFSAYESKRSASDPKPFARGINSIQLFDDGTRWYVVTVFWDSERPDNPIPEKYLKR